MGTSGHLLEKKLVIQDNNRKGLVMQDIDGKIIQDIHSKRLEIQDIDMKRLEI